MKEISVPFQEINNVLIIKLRAIGDVLLSTPTVENLKNKFPHLQIDFLTEKFASDVVIGNPAISNVLSFSKKTQSSFELIRLIQKRNYDVVIDLFANPRTALLTRLSGAKYRIGFPFRGRAYAYNYLVPPRGGEVHNVDFNLDVLRYLNIEIHSRNPFFPLSDSDREFARVWINELNLNGKRIVGINASGGWSAKKWKLEQFAQLADSIHQNFQSEILLFWGPSEQDEIERLRHTMRHGSFVIPKTTLKQMGALFQYCNAVVSNDSGPMHISAALGIPTLGIYGPTNPELQGPFGEKNSFIRKEGLDCLGCNLTECPIGNICMNELNVETVFTKFKSLIEQNKLFLS